MAFLQQGVLQPGVLSTKGLPPVVLTKRGSFSQGFYNQFFLQAKVFNMAFIQLGVFQPGVLKATGRATGGCYNEGSYNKRFLNQGFLQAGIVRPAVLKTWGSNKQGFL